MRKLVFFGLMVAAMAYVSSCSQRRGCTEPTADNYEPTADEDDGTCIPARDKLIGDFSYIRIWTDISNSNDTIDAGSIQITEANTAHNHFVANFNGSLFLQGSVSASNITFETHASQLGQYSGTGTWLTSDSVDMVLNITYIEAGANPQPYAYYCTKLAD